jgi:hypothetical protein
VLRVIDSKSELQGCEITPAPWARNVNAAATLAVLSPSRGNHWVLLHEAEGRALRQLPPKA